ncbi:MAG: hypothetical protein A4E53_04379 [Pelotomaculum sp. PtaB.Bin104]|nr:MAG: hypothetical protein A4E53_04379 [Pelotomaculum sp. PtaB.Bin104]
MGNIGKFELTDGDFYAISLAIDTARHFLKHPNISPLQVIGLGNALYALERLPLATPGAYTKFGLEFHTGTQKPEAQYISFTVAEDYFEIIQGCHQNDESAGGDSFTESGWLFDFGGERIETCDLYELEEAIEGYLELGAKITVDDKSDIEYEEDASDIGDESGEFIITYEQDVSDRWPGQKRSPSELDPLKVIVSRQEVERKDIMPTLTVLSKLTASSQIARANMEKVDIGFAGYEQDDREPFVIPEVRDYVHLLDKHFPYWLFFLSKNCPGLQCLMSCFIQPHQTDTTKAMHPPKQLQEQLTRWFSAMNQISEFAGLNDDEIDELTERSLIYFTKGR